MKNLSCIILLIIFLGNQSYAGPCCGSPPPMFKNSFSFNVLGTGTYIGFSYERLIQQRLSLELGFGVLGAGAGATYYPFGISPYYILAPYLGIKTTFNTRGAGGEKNVTYIPIGLSFFTKRRMVFGIDVGPSYQTNFSPFGKVTSEFAATFPNAKILIYGNLKISYRF